MKEVPLPDVTRVQEGRSSVVEPPLDPGWDEAAKLAWQAAVVAYDTGLRITLHDETWVVDGKPMPGYYGITVYGRAVGPYSNASKTYRDAWTYLNGIATGARAAREIR